MKVNKIRIISNKISAINITMAVPPDATIAVFAVPLTSAFAAPPTSLQPCLGSAGTSDHPVANACKAACHRWSDRRRAYSLTF